MKYRKRLTIKDIAEMAKVSDSTVSRVLNNNPNVSEGTRAKIKEIVEHHEFRPSAIARGLVTGISKTIGFITADILNPFFAEIYRGLEDYAHSNGMNVIVFSTDGKQQKELECIRILKELSAAGVVLTSVCMDEEDLRKTDEYFPVVLVNRFYENVETAYVIINNFKGSYLAISHLLELNHQNIAYFIPASPSTASNQRMLGYKQAIADKKLEVNEDLIIRVDNIGDYESGRSCVSQLIESSQPFTAIFTTNDLLALGALDFLLEKGYRVPDDISIIGFDNIRVTSHQGINLTTIDQPAYDMGWKAGLLLKKRIERDNILEYQKIIFEPTLIKRSTTCKVGNVPKPNS